MVHTGIYATSNECIIKAADNYASTPITEGVINEFCIQAEGLINAAARNVFATTSGGYALMPVGGKGLLAEIESNIVGIYIIEHKLRGEDGNKNRIISEDQINILRDAALRGLGMLRDKKIVTFIKEGT